MGRQLVLVQYMLQDIHLHQKQLHSMPSGLQEHLLKIVEVVLEAMPIFIMIILTLKLLRAQIQLQSIHLVLLVQYIIM